MPISFIMMIVSIVFYKRRFSASLFALSVFSISQFYMSFLGEGYRDLNKHLFSMNFSFDLSLYLIGCIFIFMLVEKVRR